MLEAILKEEGVTHRERYLAKLAEKSFLKLWSYPSLYRDEGLSKNGVDQEFSDLTVVFGNIVVLFSDKDIAWKEHSNLNVSWGRWYRASVFESARQLHGAESFLLRHPGRLFLDKACTKPFPLALQVENLQIHLVAVTNNSQAPAKRYFDSFARGSNPSLMCDFRFTHEDVLVRPFVVGDVDPSRTFVHVLDELSLDLLLDELATISDFTHYLRTKERAIREYGLWSAAGEEEILAYYLQEQSSDGHGDIPLSHLERNDDTVGFAIPEGEWASFRVSLEYAVRRAMRSRASNWAAVVGRFADAIVSGDTHEANDTPLEVHELAIRCMASENLRSRYALAGALFEKYHSVPTNVRSARLAFSPFRPERLYVFLFFPHRPDMVDYLEYRHERLDTMRGYAFVAQYKYPHVKEILVLGADTKGSPIASETAILADTSVPMTEEQKRDAGRMMKELNILYTIDPAPAGRTRPVKAASVPLASYPRNEPCPCGSGRKYKKCCYR
jgi:hypothetical protein